MNKKELHNRPHTFANALSKAKRNIKEPYLFKHYLSLALAWAKSGKDIDQVSKLYEQSKTA
jgi:hypothetical protein